MSRLPYSKPEITDLRLVTQCGPGKTFSTEPEELEGRREDA
jgi:hypothetical protein